ncbi:WD domain, G-beta repeat protein [Toxoplasma gondii GAB2-2007-GAL-DOM2]|uniref:WD domain, G-beta repeat protein n=1 Tax=Toxoplasma gondii GAB2-2007-GAL-DOM2 TaxID=1130820 RepID=A0A086KAV7_TOXGO|nr:WD domain, G-beta repeat protein [Toxoplasma gondii GAB2-2007-GAL-DOM2]
MKRRKTGGLSPVCAFVSRQTSHACPLEFRVVPFFLLPSCGFQVLQGVRDREITAMSFDMRARLLYVGDSAGNIESFNALTGAAFQTFCKHPCDVCLFAFWGTSSNFLSASTDGLVMLHEQDGNAFALACATAPSPSRPGAPVALSEQVLASSSRSAAAVRYRVQLGPGGCSAMAVATALELVACASSCSVHVLCLKTLRRETTLRGPCGSDFSVAAE